MSQVLEGLDEVVCQMDDILDTQAQHDKRLVAVLVWFTKAGVTLKSKRCDFAKTLIKLLGQIIDSTSVKADPEKVNMVSNMEADVSGARQFLKMVNHQGNVSPPSRKNTAIERTTP